MAGIVASGDPLVGFPLCGVAGIVASGDPLVGFPLCGAIVTRALELLGPVLCGLGAACMLGALAVDLDSTAAKVLMASAAILFVPGAILTLGTLRHKLGPPQ